MNVYIVGVSIVRYYMLLRTQYVKVCVEKQCNNT